MNKAELARVLAAEAGTSVHRAESIVDCLVEIMGRTLASGESITLSNFGTLRPSRRKPRSFGAHEGPRAMRPDRVQVSFRAASRLLEAVEAGDDQVTFRKRPRALPAAS